MAAVRPGAGRGRGPQPSKGGGRHRGPVHPRGGIDEAGRGPVLGPLVVAGVAGDPAELKALGCRDSKTLSPAKRERLARLIRADAFVTVRVLEAADLDVARDGTSLNTVEARMFRDVAAELAEAGARSIVVDAADVDARRFGRAVGEGLAVRVDARHHADEEDPVVGAASIVAKVTRDAAVAELARRLERELPFPLGSGYASDPYTRRFIHEWHERFGDVPEGTRRSWRTVQALVGPQQQRLPV